MLDHIRLSIPAVATAAHAASDSMALEQALKVLAGVLCALAGDSRLVRAKLVYQLECLALEVLGQ
jgi:hypothetical protein